MVKDVFLLSARERENIVWFRKGMSMEIPGDLRSKSLDERDNVSVHELGVEQPA